MPLVADPPRLKNVRVVKALSARAVRTASTASPRGIVKEFIDFTLGDAGQKIVEQVGFVPIK